MAVLALLSAKGAPGVTTSALLLAALWPRQVLLVDADTEGGDIAYRLPRADGAPVDRSRGLLSLLSLARRELSPTALPEHAQTLAGGTELLAGLAGPEQAGAAGQLWHNLGRSFAGSTDRDLVVDCGRVGAGSVHLPLLQQADLALCVLRPTVSQVVQARERLAALAPLLAGGSGSGPHLGVLVVGPPGGSRDVDATHALIERDLPDVTSYGVLAHDVQGASVFEGAQVSRPERTLLVRSGREVVERLADMLAPRPAAVTAPEPDAEHARPARRRRLRRPSTAERRPVA